MNLIVEAAKKLLNGKKLFATTVYDDSPLGLSLREKCPACGEKEKHVFRNVSGAYVCICPNTSAKIYAGGGQ